MTHFSLPLLAAYKPRHVRVGEFDYDKKEDEEEDDTWFSALEEQE